MKFNLPPSKIIKGLEWTGDRIGYPEPKVKGDSFPMTWGRDGEIYTSAGDPNWGDSHSGLDIEKFTGGPTDYKITKVNHMNDHHGWGGNGPKPTGMISINNILYLFIQNVLRAKPPAHGYKSQHGSDSHILYAEGENGFPWWTPSFDNIGAPMFLGNKFGGPSFINFGRDNEGARDNYVYAISPDQWDNGSNLRLGRVPKEEILRPSAWEWVIATLPSGEPAWGYNLTDSVPILSLHRHLSQPEMVYVAALKRYLFFTWQLNNDFSPYDGSSLLVLEAPEPWGPFSLVHYEETWEQKEVNPYCPRLPLKWMDPFGTSGWLQFSGSWAPHGQVEGSYYRSNVRPFRFKMV